MDDEERQAIISSIPEFASFEGQKENVMPRRQGRSAATLSSVYQTTTQEREQQLQQGHDQFARELEDIEDLDDPLDVYLRYIQWTVEMYPEGHNQGSDLRGLLEETTQRFQKSKRYQLDVRYLKCWIHYIEYLDNPNEAYQLLMRNNIGQNAALFYEEYANYLEGRRKYQDAKNIYNLGIERQAEPINRLIRKRKHFLERIYQQRQEQQQSSTTARAGSMNGRVPLGMKYSSASTSSSSGSSRPASSSSRQAQFSVYTGPELDSTSVVPSSSSPSSSLVNNSYQRIENQPKISKFAGTTLPQKPHRRPKSSSSFSVFRDDQSQNNSGEEEQHTTQMSIVNTEHRTRTAAPLAPPYLQERFKAHHSQYIKSNDTLGKAEYIAASKKCTGEDDSDSLISFEEMRYEYQDWKKYDISNNGESSQHAEQESGSPISEPVDQQTQETRAAQRLLNSVIFATASDDLEEDDDPISFTHGNVRRRFTDENAVPTLHQTRPMDISRQGSNMLDEMDTLDDTDDEDMDNAMRQEAARVPHKRPRTFPH